MRNYRNAFIAFILVVCLIVMMMTILANADDKIRTSARSAIVYQPDTNSFPYAKNADEQLASGFLGSYFGFSVEVFHVEILPL